MLPRLLSTPNVWLQNRPWEKMSPFGVLDRYFQDMMKQLAGDSPSEFPPINMWENDGVLFAEVALAGYKPDEVNVSFSGDELRIEGKHEIARDEEHASYHRKERQVTSFARAITVPFPVNSDKVQANFSNGVLTVQLPKAKEAQPLKIKVESSGK